MSGFPSFWLRHCQAVLSQTQDIRIPHAWFAGSTLVLAIGLVFLLVTAGYHAAFADFNALGKGLSPWFWQNLTTLGDGRILVLLALVLAHRRAELFWAMVLVAILTLLVGQGFKPLIGAWRPASVLEPGSFVLMGKPLFLRSFPSGHSLGIAAFVGILWALAPSWIWRFGLGLLALLVGMSRVAVGAHWPVDVVTGLGLGFGLAWLGLWLAGRLRFGLHPLGHGLGILLCLGNSYSLLYDSAGYPEALVLGQMLVLLIWLLLAYEYLWRPFFAWCHAEGRHPLGCVRDQLVRRLDLLFFLALALVFLIWPRLDIQVSSWFYQADSGFFLANNPLVRLSYRLFANLHLFVLVFLVGLLIWQKIKRKPSRAGWFLVLALVLGPGLVVNGLFKEEWGRARPRDIVEFGGSSAFSGAFIKSDQCSTNCSFVSGHAAMGFYLLVLAWVLKRRYWLWLGLLLGSLVGLGRLMQGGHFLSDLVFAFWAVYFTGLLLARWFYPARPAVSGA